MAANDPCSQEGCSKLVGRGARGLCPNCYCSKWQKINPEKHKNTSKKYYDANSDLIRSRVAAYTRTPRGRFSTAKNSAKARGLEFKLGLDQYLQVVSAPCHYCSGSLPEAGGGLDRLDSSFGYIPGNVVPCCTRCNVVKGQYLTPEIMIQVASALGWRTNEESNEKV